MNCCASSHRVFLFLLLLVSTATEITAQQAVPLHFNYNTDAGLPSSECYEIIQDRRGYIWISSDNGVSRYDGYEFENFGTEEGLTDKTILNMHEDHRGWIWMSSLAGNFFIYRADTIAAFEHNHLIQNIRDKFYLIKDFIVDTSGAIDFGLYNYDLARITAQGELFFTDYTHEQQGSNLYFIKDQRLLSVNRRRSRPSLEERIPYRDSLIKEGLIKRSLIYSDSIHVRMLPFDFDGLQYTGSNSATYETLLDTSLLIRKYSQLYWFPNFKRKSYRLGTTNGKELLWLTNDHKTGGFYAGYNKGEGLRYFANLDDLLADRPVYNILQEHTITHILQQPDGELWVGTLENGIYFLPNPRTLYFPNSTQYTFKAISRYHEDGILSSSIKGKMLAITKDFRVSSHSQPSTTTSISSIYYDNDGIDLLTVASPLYIWQDKRWQLLFDDDPARFSQSLLPIRSLVSSLDGEHLWFIYPQTGVKLVKAPLVGGQSITTVQTILPEKKVTSLLELPNSLLLGTHDGLFRFDKKSTQASLAGDAPIFQERVEDIYRLSDTLIAVATRGSGLYLMGPHSLQNWTVDDGLASNAITFIKADGKICWLGSKAGLHRIDLQQGLASLYIYTEKDGLAGGEILDLIIEQDHAWVLTKSGLAKIDKQPPARTLPSSVFINRFMVNSQEVDLSGSHPLDFNWTKNNIQLRFQFLSYAQLDDRQYRFRLKPEEDWTYPNTNQLDLLNLSPDTYLLEIQARDKWRKWVASNPIPFTIRPPFWRTPFFFLSCLIAGLVLSWWFFRQRIQNLSRERETLKLQEEVSQLKQQAYRAQMNPHFIFNCLGTIQGMVMGDKTDKDRAVRLIASFSQLIRFALDASRQDFVSLQEEVSLLNRYLALERERFSHSFEFTIEVDPDLETDWIQIPPMLVQPYVENAVLHGMEGKEKGGYIRVLYEQTDGHLQVTIEDNGPGIFQTQSRQKTQLSKHKHRSVGMMITQKRLEMLSNGDLRPFIRECQNKNGDICGTIIQLKVPL